MAKSILPVEFRGVMFLTGRRGFGKSWLASQTDDPENVLFIDYDDGKGEAIHNRLHFGDYYNILAMAAGKGNAGIWDATIDIIKRVPNDRFTVAVLDNVSPLELAMKAEAVRGAKEYAKQFGLKEANIVSGNMGGSSSVANFLIVDKITAPLHARGVKLIVVTSQVKPPWAGGPIPNKFQGKGSDRWQELSVLSLIIVAGDYPPAPSAIVQKEALGELTFNRDTGEFTPKRTLPLRLPKATFAEIKRYMREPANLNDPAEGEVPSDEELSMYGDKMTKEQLGIMRLMLQSSEREAVEESAGSGILGNSSTSSFEPPAPAPPVELSAEQRARVLALKAEGRSAGDIRKLFADEGIELPLASIIKAKPE